MTTVQHNGNGRIAVLACDSSSRISAHSGGHVASATEKAPIPLPTLSNEPDVMVSVELSYHCEAVMQQLPRFIVNYAVDFKDSNGNVIKTHVVVGLGRTLQTARANARKQACSYIKGITYSMVESERRSL